MTAGGKLSNYVNFVNDILISTSLAYMINENSIQWNVVSKRLGSERMSFYLNEAAGDIRDLMMTTLEAPKPKL
jgi:hypothetical protein